MASGVLPDRRPVGGVVASREHILDIERETHPALHGASIDRLQGLTVRAQNDDRVDHQRIVSVAGGVLVSLADQAGGRANHAARQEGDHVELLPCREILAHHDRNFRVEHR
jgi:hypothetical protein